MKVVAAATTAAGGEGETSNHASESHNCEKELLLFAPAVHLLVYAGDKSTEKSLAQPFFISLNLLINNR